MELFLKIRSNFPMILVKWFLVVSSKEKFAIGSLDYLQNSTFSNC
jgi:hypothetical protein